MAMDDLKEEYTDAGGRTHRVEHFVVTVTSGDSATRERIGEELLHALTGPDEHGAS